MCALCRSQPLVEEIWGHQGIRGITGSKLQIIERGSLRIEALARNGGASTRRGSRDGLDLDEEEASEESQPASPPCAAGARGRGRPRNVLQGQEEGEGATDGGGTS